jgi:hypothetical protein
MTDSMLVDLQDCPDTGSEDGHSQLGFLLLSTVVFGLSAGFMVLWNGGTFFSAFLAYMAGGWCGIGLAALTILRRNAAL